MARPLGGVLNGLLADKLGRRTAVLVSLVGMMLATMGQGMLPTVRCCGETAGSAGLVLLVSLRAIQGVCAGGELGAIVAYLSESAPQSMLCSGTALVTMTAVLGFLLASGFVNLLLHVLGAGGMLEWGWRLPFLVVVIPGIISLWGRANLNETDQFKQVKQTNAERSTMELMKLLFRDHIHGLVLGFAGVAGIAVTFYSAVWCTSYLKSLGLSQAETLGISCSQMGVIALGFFFFALLNDMYLHWEPIRWMVLGSLLQALLGVFVFWSVSLAGSHLLVVGHVVVGLVWGCTVGSAGSHMYLFVADLFPTHLRALGFGLSFNVAFAYLGGSAALVDVALSKALPSTGPGLYWSLVSFGSLLVLLWGHTLCAKGKLPRHLTCRQSEATQKSFAAESRTDSKDLENQTDTPNTPKQAHRDGLENCSCQQ
eukprot:TRINITY_DN20815_c0_g1_i1.p1 TRINITY_DN20815_c0_g1~~TRINITY_DN20815_c0_g1_i1.p1  ORF type:complete len:426 (-),score=65.90 TRINITY_DN20815_c0_g1_i1:378-1655(-)